MGSRSGAPSQTDLFCGSSTPVLGRLRVLVAELTVGRGAPTPANTQLSVGYRSNGEVITLAQDGQDACGCVEVPVHGDRAQLHAFCAAAQHLVLQLTDRVKQRVWGEADIPVATLVVDGDLSGTLPLLDPECGGSLGQARVAVRHEGDHRAAASIATSEQLCAAKATRSVPLSGAATLDSLLDRLEMPSGAAPADLQAAAEQETFALLAAAMER